MEREAIHELSAAYALDALDPTEERTYEEHLAHCPVCQDEVAELRATAALLAYVPDEPAPPSALGERIVAMAREDRAKVVPLASRRLAAWPSAVAAVAAVVALGLGLWTLSLSRSLDEQRQAFELLTDPAAEAVELSGANGRLLVGEDGRAVLVVSGVERAPSGHAYQLWVIAGGTPAPAGLFRGGGERAVVELTREVPPGAQVAATVERQDGVDAPTTEPVFSAST